MTEFDEWAKRFEAREVVDRYDKGVPQMKTIPMKCMFPVKEGPHKVAHLVTAHHRSIDGYPVCQCHAHKAVRPTWRGYVEGA